VNKGNVEKVLPADRAFIESGVGGRAGISRQKPQEPGHGTSVASGNPKRRRVDGAQAGPQCLQRHRLSSAPVLMVRSVDPQMPLRRHRMAVDAPAERGGPRLQIQEQGAQRVSYGFPQRRVCCAAATGRDPEGADLRLLRGREDDAREDDDAVVLARGGLRRRGCASDDRGGRHHVPSPRAQAVRSVLVARGVNAGPRRDRPRRRLLPVLDGLERVSSATGCAPAERTRHASSHHDRA
jgi:hypothetical protein